MARKYSAIWTKIKKDGKCTVEVIPQLMLRVKRAVIKEKGKDVGFKLLNDHDNFRLEISYDAEKKRLTFVLRQTLGLEGRNL